MGDSRVPLIKGLRRSTPPEGGRLLSGIYTWKASSLYFVATLSQLWATVGYGSLLFWATWLFRYTLKGSPDPENPRLLS